MIARQVQRIKARIYESATEFPPCSYRIFIREHRAVPLQAFTTRHSNHIFHSYGFANHFYAMRPESYQIQ